MILYLLACPGASDGLETGRKCSGSQLVDISAGDGTYCMVDNEGCLECRYYDESSRDITHVPIESVPEGEFQSVHLTESGWGEYGAVAGCAIDTDNHPHCWEPEKKNFWGESSPSPEEEVIMIANHERAPCAARVAGGAHCWGSGGHDLDIDVVFRDIAVAAIEPDRLALSEEGDLYAWNINLRIFDVVRGPFVAIDSVYTTCALHESEGMKCWSYLTNEKPPDVVDPDVKGQVLCYSLGENCVLTYEGTVQCDGLSPEFDVPLTTLSCAYNKTMCGLTASGEARCWSPERGMWKLP